MKLAYYRYWLKPNGGNRIRKIVIYYFSEVKKKKKLYSFLFRYQILFYFIISLSHFISLYLYYILFHFKIYAWGIR